MKRFATALIAGLLSLLAAAQWTPEARALSCAQFSAAEHVERADAVLTGSVQSVSPPHRVQVAVDRYLKGSGPGVVTIRSGDGSGWSRQWLPQDIGQGWLFFLHDGDGHFLDKLCSASSPLDADRPIVAVSEVEAVTGPGVEPVQVNPDGLSPAVTVEPGQGDPDRVFTDTPGDGTTRLVWAAGAVGVLAAASLIGLRAVYTRRRST